MQSYWTCKVKRSYVMWMAFGQTYSRWCLKYWVKEFDLHLLLEWLLDRNLDWLADALVSIEALIN